MEDSLHIFRRFARINVNARCSSRYKVKNFLVDRMAFNGLHYLYLKHACDNICKLQMFRNGVIYTMACLRRRSCVTTDGLTTLYFFDFYEPMPIDKVEKQVTIFLRFDTVYCGCRRISIIQTRSVRCGISWIKACVCS